MPVWLNGAFRSQSGAPFVFADRDGTLIEHVDYLGDPKCVVPLPGVREAVREILVAGAAFFVFTNQSGVGRGYYSMDAVHACNRRMFELLGVRREQVAGICVAPGTPSSGDPYRKPSPKFIEEALRRFGADAGQAHMIGDTAADLETACNANIRGWLVRSGKPEAVDAYRAGALAFDCRCRPAFADCIREILAPPADNRS